MSKRLPWLCFLCVPFVSGCGMNWQDYESTDGKFAVKLPGSPKCMERTMATPIGRLTIKMVLAESKNWAYGVGYADLPKGKPFDLHEAVRGTAMGVGGKVLVQRPCTLDGIKGSEFEIEVTKPDNGFAAGRIYVTKGRYYQILAIGNSTRLDSSDVQEFLDSFKFKFSKPATAATAAKQ